MCDVIDTRMSRLKQVNFYWLLLHQKQKRTQPAPDVFILGTDKRKQTARAQF